MVLFDSNFRAKNREAIKKARSEKIRVVRLEENLYYCARRAKGHGRYLVQLDVTKSGLFANCRTIRGASCPSYGCCTHIAAVYERMVAQVFKTEKKEAA